MENDNPLYKASQEGDTAEVIRLVKEGANTSYKSNASQAPSVYNSPFDGPSEALRLMHDLRDTIKDVRNNKFTQIDQFFQKNTQAFRTIHEDIGNEEYTIQDLQRDILEGAIQGKFPSETRKDFMSNENRRGGIEAGLVYPDEDLKPLSDDTKFLSLLRPKQLGGYISPAEEVQQSTRRAPLPDVSSIISVRSTADEAGPSSPTPLGSSSRTKEKGSEGRGGR